MKTKMFKSTLSLLLVLLLCVSVITPAMTAASDTELAPVGDEGVVLEKRADNVSLSRAELIELFGDSTLSTAYYGVAPAPETGTEPDISTITYVTLTSPARITAGEWLALKTTAATGSLFNRQPDWTQLAATVPFSVRTYYSASFSVNGAADGALYLNGEEVDGSVNLFTDSTYTVTAKEVEGFTCEVNGVVAGEEFTPGSDLTITAEYVADASASVELTTGEGGTAEIIVDGIAVDDAIPAGKKFSVSAEPNTRRGYKLDSVVVKKNGEAVEAVDGEYGPVADGEAYTVEVSFKYEPDVVNAERQAPAPRLYNSDFSEMTGNSGNYSYGFAKIGTDSITNVSLTGQVLEPGEYLVYRASYTLIGTPNWNEAQIYRLRYRLYYNVDFSVSGCEDGAVYLDGEAVSGAQKLYTDTEYTVTAKSVDDYEYVINGAADGEAFYPSSGDPISVTYLREEFAAVSVEANEGGAVKVMVGEDEALGRVAVGESFTVEAIPDADKGYKLESVVVTKDGEAVEATDGAYGPVADGEEYVVTVTFKFDPDVVEYEAEGLTPRLYPTSDFYAMFGSESGTYSYGYAKVDADSVNNLGILGADFAAGEYLIYRAPYSLLNPDWTKAKVLKLNLRTYFNIDFTVTGSEDGAVYLDGEAVSGTQKLYTDKEYTVTAKEVEGYNYSIEGAQDGVAFAPTSASSIRVVYLKEEFATVTVNDYTGGSVTILTNGEITEGRVNADDTFTVEATPDADRGYKLESVTVTKDGEAVEAVDGVYGPVAGDEVYEVSVVFVFDPDTVEYELDANDPYLTYDRVRNMFSGGLLNTYGYAREATPDDIHTATLLGDGDVIEPGVYYIYQTSIIPNWSTASVLKANIRTYYNGTFTVSGHEDGELCLNGEPVSGGKRLFTDEEYTVTVKQIEQYIVTLYGAEDGVAFTPTADVDVTASYMKEKYATITVNANEGGTVNVLSNGEPVIDKIPEEDTFEVKVTPDSSRAYYVESVVVTKNGEEIEAVDGVYGPVMDTEQYEVNVTFARATLTLNDCDVTLTDIMDKKIAEIEQTILSNATLTPAAFADSAQTKVEYVASTILGIEDYEPLNHVPGSISLNHAFGTSARDGELLDGNTEKVRVTYTLPEQNIRLQATATVTVKEVREATSVKSKFVTITYGDDLKSAIMDAISVYNSNNEPIEFSADEITITPDKLNVKLLAAQEVTVRYEGSERYAISEGTANVYVRRAPSSIDTKSETVSYGETPAAEVRTTPENLDFVRVIAGIDGEAMGFVSIDIPDSTKESMKIKIGDTVLFDIYDFLQRNVGEGVSPGQLKNIITSLFESLNSNETIRQASETIGFNMDVFEAIVSFVDELPEFNPRLTIRMGRVPTNAGMYLMSAFSTDSNYTLSTDLSYIVILPKTTTEDSSVELRFRSEIGDPLNTLKYEEAQEFVFGGDLYVDGEIFDTDKLHVLYTGTTLTGDIISQEEPVREPGFYTETIYLLGGNYIDAPLIRAFTINRIETDLRMDDLTVPYDGKQHSTEAYFADGAELSGDITYIYSGSGYYGNVAPVAAGEYTVYAFYSGDVHHMSASVLATLTIAKLPATITVSCEEEIVYGEIGFNNIKKANLSYTVSGTINNERLGFITPYLVTGDDFPNVGEYTATAHLYQINPNYDVTIEDAVLTIVPRPATIKVTCKEEIAYGDIDFDSIASAEIGYTVSGTVNGDEVGHIVPNLDVAGGFPNVGEYAASVFVFQHNHNYTVTIEDAVLKIVPRKVILAIDNAEKYIGEDDPAFTFTATDEEGSALDIEEIGLSVIREEGEAVGNYRIYAEGVENVNYELDLENSTEGVFTISEKPVMKQYMIGDVDGDGEISSLDVTMIQRKLAFIDVYGEFNEAAADVDGDGEISSLDVTMIQRYLSFIGQNIYNIGELVEVPESPH